ncbi:MAG: hypothetical protein ACQKBT_02520 [Puniceicoccales bacterium]
MKSHSEGRIFFLYKKTAVREEALSVRSASSGYSLYGFFELQEAQYPVEAVYGDSPTGIWRIIGAVVRRLNLAWTGYSSNPRAVLPHLKHLRGAAGIVATSNNVGLPLLLLRRFGLVKAPVFLISVGLEAYRNDGNSARCRRLGRLLRDADQVVVFSEDERDFLQERLSLQPGQVQFVPYGFHSRYFPKFESRSGAGGELLMVGADAQRDVELLREWSLRNPSIRIRCVLSEELVLRLPSIPDSWELEQDIPFVEVLKRLREASRVVIPVKKNLYTAGTTFMIQALAVGVPVLVARTGVLTGMEEARPFPFITYEPEDLTSFDKGMERLRSMSPEESLRVGEEGRRWVERWGDGRALQSALVDFADRSLCS